MHSCPHFLSQSQPIWFPILWDNFFPPDSSVWLWKSEDWIDRILHKFRVDSIFCMHFNCVFSGLSDLSGIFSSEQTRHLSISLASAPYTATLIPFLIKYFLWEGQRRGPALGGGTANFIVKPTFSLSKCSGSLIYLHVWGDPFLITP